MLPQETECHKSVIVSALGTAGQLLHGEIRKLGNRSTQVHLDQPLQYASLVMIEYDDKRLLGEVIYCEKKQASWLVGIRIEHVLLGPATLNTI